MLYVIEDIGSRKYQEDKHSICFNFFKNFHYFSVFDGHGDDKVAIFLKLHLKDIIKTELNKSYQKISIEQCLYNAIKIINTIIPYNIGLHSGSTVIVIIKQQDKIFIINIGDSRVITNNFNKAIQITEDHKPDVPSEYKRITDLGGSVTEDIYGTYRINNILSLSRAIGDFHLLPYISSEPDIYSMKINKSNKYLIAATDGLWDVFDNQELINYINKFIENIDLELNNHEKKISSICKNLIKIARKKGSKDNITILLLIL